LRVGPSFERDGTENLLGFGAALELPIFDRNQGEIALKLAERDQKRRLYVAALQSARADLEGAWAALESLDAELKYYFQEVAPRLEKTLEITEKALKAGEVSLHEVLDVNRRLLLTRGEILKSLRDFHKAGVEVDRAAGPRVKPAGQ
jgi:outer membrane protein TolC